MSTPVTMERIAEASPRPAARITGVVYLLYFLTAVLGEFFLRGLVVDGDAAATANNLLAHQPLFRLGWATGLISTACYIAVTALFYGLFKPVNRSLSLVAAFLSLSGCTILAFASLFQLAPLFVLGGSQYLSVFTVEQLRALALMFLELNAQAVGICLVFFAFYDLLIGYLIFQSAFLPGALGGADGVGRFGLDELSVPAAGKLFVSLHPGPRLRRGTIADAVAPREGRERSTMEGAGECSMKARVCHRRRAPTPRLEIDRIA